MISNYIKFNLFEFAAHAQYNT